MKIRTIIALSVLLIFSCQSEKKSNRLETDLKKSVTSSIILDSMLNPTSNTNFIDKKSIEIPDDSLKIVRNNFLEKFKHLLKTPFFNELYISRALFKGRHVDNPTIDNKYFIGYYFMKVFNRTSKNIENFFGDKEIELLAQMIGESYNYINSNTYLWLDGCIQAFDELKSDPDFFRQASKESDYDKYRDLVSSKYSEKVTKIIDFSSEYDTDDKLFKIYSFWVRRYNEGNADVVFTILKKIKNQLPSKTETDNLDFEKNTIESKILNDNFTAFDFNEEALNLLISKMDVRENYFERFIAENSIFIPRIDVSDREFFSDRYSTKLMGKLNEAYSDFDRSPENIKIIFNESLINHIAFLFNNGLLPKDQRIYDVLKGLLLTYDEMQDDECLRLFQIIKKYEYEYENMRNEFDKKCSDKVREFVFDGGDFKSSIKNDSDIDFGFSKRIFYLYSFWARRYKEGNKETVYKILKEIDEKIK